MLGKRVVLVRQRISAACQRSGRSPSEITLLAVSKGRGVEEVTAVLEAGVEDIGENRIQEALLKYSALRKSPHAKNPRWHMVGHLQTNKARDAVGIFDLIHSVDSLRLAREIDKQAARLNKVQDILLEVKTSSEESKYGLSPQEAPALLDEVRYFKNIAVRGLMTIAALGNSAEDSRPYFRQLCELFRKINAGRMAQEKLSVLSMGMSDDFEVAIEEGATMVRLGRALFAPDAVRNL